MTQEIKESLKQAATAHTKGSFDYESAYIGFKAGAQTILENPADWGLWKQYDVVKHVNEVANEAAKVGRELAERQLQSQLAKYREALERIVNYDYDSRNKAPYHIAKEALKQQ